MRRLVLCLAVVLGALVAASAALADGPLFVTQGGAGAATRGGSFHYVTLRDGPRATLLEAVDFAHKFVRWGMRLDGSWGTPVIGNGSVTGEGLSPDGSTLVLASTAGPYASPSRFIVLDPRHMKILRTIVLHGSFSYDAISPDASRLYLIQYTHAGSYNLNHYVVRGYDMRTGRLMPGRIVDRAEPDEKMTGNAITRTTSADGRWVYTLYQKTSGEPFVHALDTVTATAHCVDLPENDGLYDAVLSLRDDGRTLAVHWRSGRPWLRVAVASWQISYPRPGFPWAWVGAGSGGGLALLAAGALLLRRRRGEELQQHPGDELGLA
ncbi:MAG TPA: hypothetical protein VJV76_05670 [Gaiellaceae bacterium]|nr:hypothetical protein [Gaiellaceae bacterium]